MNIEPHQLSAEPVVLSSATWDRVKAIFEEVRELPPDERPLRLDAACAGNRDVRREVESLLRRDAVDPLIGQGEMGTVYRAVRADAAYEKDVAIKVISPGRSSAATLSYRVGRFLHRQRMWLRARRWSRS